MSTDDQALRPPPLDSVAAFVRLQRGLYGWKRETLAAKAGVSLSTVERVERAERVRPASLEALALALNLSREAFTEPRRPLSDDEVCRLLQDSIACFEGTIPVPVEPLRTEPQLRLLASSEIGITTSDVEGADDVIETIQEWLDLTGFMRAQDGQSIFPKRERSFPMRKLYRDVLEYVRQAELQHKAVCLVGQYEAKGNLRGFETLKVGIVAFRSREENPAAQNIRKLLAPEDVDVREVFRADLEKDF